MTLEFLSQIGADSFIANASKTFTLVECARFFEIELANAENLLRLVDLLSKSHIDIFYYAFYFACWDKADVPKHQRVFKDFDDQILDRV